MDMRALRVLLQGKSFGVSPWAVLYYVGEHSSLGGLDTILEGALAEYKAESDKRVFVDQLEFAALNDKKAGPSSTIAKGIQVVIAYGGETALSWLPEEVHVWAAKHGVVVVFRTKGDPVAQDASKPSSVTLANVVQHPLLPNWVNLLIGLVCVALVVEIFSGWLGIPKLLAGVLAVALAAFALQKFSRKQASEANDRERSDTASTPLAMGPSPRHWLIGIAIGLAVVGVLFVALWSTGEDVTVAEKPKSPVMVMTPTPSSGGDAVKGVATEGAPADSADGAVVVSRNKTEDPALGSVINGFVVDMYACARSLEQLKQVGPEGNLPSTYAQLLQLNISGVDSTLTDKWGNLVSAVTRTRAPKEMAAWYNESDTGGRYGVYHDAVVVVCDLITKDLSRVFTEWANAASTDAPDFSSLDAVITQLDEANASVVAAASQVGVALDEYHPDWQALKNGFTMVIRPTPVPTPKPTTAPRIATVPSNPGGSSPGVVPTARAVVPTSTPLPEPTAVPTPEPTVAPPFDDDPGPFPGDVLSDVPCMPYGTKGKYYLGGAINPSEVRPGVPLSWLNVVTCAPHDVAVNNAYVLIGAYCTTPDVCYAVVEMLDGPSRGSRLYVDGPFHYRHP